MKKEEKFKINVMGNSIFTLDILNQYKLKISPQVKIESIVIDVFSPNDTPTYITLLGNHLNRNTAYANTLNIKDFSFTELADLVMTMIKLYRPTDIKLDANGMGRGLLDALYFEFKKENIHYGDNGVIDYDFKHKEKEVKVTDKRKVEIEEVIEITKRELNHYRCAREAIGNTFGVNSSSNKLLKMIELNEEIIKQYDEELFYEKTYG